MKEKTVSSTFIGAVCCHLFACDKVAMKALVGLLVVGTEQSVSMLHMRI